MFRQAFECEDMRGVWRDENHLVVRHSSGVFFSFAQVGMAISAHFAAGKDALRSIRYAIDEFCDWAFHAMPWCEMILANIDKPSVSRLVSKCNFCPLTTADNSEILVRYRPWAKV